MTLGFIFLGIAAVWFLLGIGVGKCLKRNRQRYVVSDRDKKRQADRIKGQRITEERRKVVRQKMSVIVAGKGFVDADSARN